MNLTAAIKRAPKGAYYVAGGLALGIVGIEVYKRRAADTAAPTDTTNDATVAGTPTGSAAPSPVITPPVIIQPDTSGSPDYAGIFGAFGDALNNAVGNLAGLAQGDQGITQTSVTTVGDIARDVIAQAGQAPVPAVQQPAIVVNVPAPTPAISVPSGPAPCPSAFPHRSSRGCYRCEQHGKKYTHIYQSGTRVGENTAC